MGKVYLVGAGPGDLKLITVKGLELIMRADCLIYDYLANNGLLGFARKDAELIYVGKQGPRHALSQSKINELLVRKAKERSTVVRLKGGDPFVFGRGGEEAVFLAENGVKFEIVPGVTSAISVPAYAGIPLTHRGFASSAAIVTGHEGEEKTVSTIRWRELAAAGDTLVFLMGIKNLSEIKEKLIAQGKDPETPSCVIQWGTLPKQKVVSGPLRIIDGIAEAAGIAPPGIIVVGEVVNLRGKLGWFEQLPLFGKTIVVTRAPHQSIKLGELLSEKGADVIYAPTIEVKPIEPNDRLLHAICNIGEYYGLIFTSVNGVSVFFDNLIRLRHDSRRLAGIKIIPIGKATAAILESKGVMPDFVPEIYTSEGVVEVLKGIQTEGRKFLLPRAEEARDVIEGYITEHGGQCDVVSIYRTDLPENPLPISVKPDVVTFTSSSTARNFLKIYGKDILDCALIASIGPVTTETLRKHSIEADIIAGQYDIEGLVKAIVDHISADTD